MSASSPSFAARCRHALRLRLLQSRPDAIVDESGYVVDWRLNLLPGIAPEWVEGDFRQGSGNELGGKFRAAHSSSALVANVFAPFKQDPQALKLPGAGAIGGFCFERKCPTGLKGTPPNLDLVAFGADGIVGVESKCLEPFTTKLAKFSDAYLALPDERKDSGWFRELSRLRDEPGAYAQLDAAQLVKHAFGLWNTWPGASVTLLYLYWEPLDCAEHPILSAHRAELESFARRIEGVGPSFRALPYSQLLAHWETPDAPHWLVRHLRQLRERYFASA